MCGRTSLFVPEWLLEERFDASARPGLPRGYNLAPRDDLAVIRGDAPDEIDALEWGLLPSWAENPADGPRPINARAESLSDTPVFSDAFERRRCLVLADGFYEWQGDRGNRQPYRFVRPDNQPFAMAGVWDRWKGEGGDEGHPHRALESVAIVTTAANDLMADVHDRMPVVFEPGTECEWLADSAPEVLQGLLDPPREDLLRYYPVSRRVNDPTNDGPDVVKRTSATTQSRLGSF